MQQDTSTKQYSGVSGTYPAQYQEFLTNAPIGIFTYNLEGRFLSVNPAFSCMLGYEKPQELLDSVIDIDTQFYEDPKDSAKLRHLIETNGQVEDFECKVVKRNGSILWTSLNVKSVCDETGKIIHYQGFAKDITERKQEEMELKRIQWMFNPATVHQDNALPEYGNLMDLNTSRVILDAVGEDLLTHIVKDFLDLLETSVAVYEANGDYALGIFSSKWCRFLDTASRRLCNTPDNSEALTCGKWLCHDSCWGLAKTCMERGEPVDIECVGKIRLYAVPIRSMGKVIGTINLGYGDPPQDLSTLNKLAEEYKVDFQDLVQYAQAYESRPTFLVENAKQRMETAAHLIGEIVERKQAEEELRKIKFDYQSITNLTGDIIVQIDTQGRWTFLNDQACNFWGKSREELLGCFFSEYLHPDDQEMTSNATKSVMDGKTVSLENRQKTPEGWRTVQWNVAPIYQDGECSGLQVTGRDITDNKQAEEELQFQNIVLTTQQEVSPDGILVVNEDFKIIDFNQRFVDIWEIPDSIMASQSEEKTINFVLHKLVDPEAFLNRIYRIYENKQDKSHDEIPLTDGRILERYSAPMFGDNEQYYGRVWYYRDITDRKQAEEQLRKHSKAVEQNPASIVITDLDGSIEYVNPAFTKITGYTSDEVIGENPRLLKSSDKSSEEYKELWDTITSGKEWRGEFKNISKKEEIYWESASIAPIFNDHGQATHYIGIKEDITQRKLADQALLKAKQDAEVSNQSKSEFLANMSHEIRTPINGIMGMLQLLQNSSLNQEQEKFVGIGLDSTKRLNRLLTDILDLSKIEANKLVIKEQEFIFADVIQSIKDIFNQLTQENQNDIVINLDENIPEKLIGDSTRLNQILFNLVGNANKYTLKGQIELEVTFLSNPQVDKCRLLFVVADNGPGISEDRIDKIFDIFTQGSDTSPYSRDFEGAGLGLPLVKRLVDLLNGSISVSSKEGEGTSVYVSLPFRVPESLQHDTTELYSGEQENKAMDLQVLLVDDDVTTQLVIRTLLEKFGCIVTVVGDGEKALSVLENKKFDCILMDIQMPVLDGIEATKQISFSNADYKNIPVIAMTAYAMSGDREKFLDHGMDDYIAKPVDQDELIQVLERNLFEAKN